MIFIYFIIPTINGEISGEPYIFRDKELLKYINEEATIYKINLNTLEVFEWLKKEIGEQ